LIIVESPVMTSKMIHAVPFKETSMHSCEALVYMILYSNGLKCTEFTIFFFKLCHANALDQ
jgi:hypothetical protein